MEVRLIGVEVLRLARLVIEMFVDGVSFYEMIGF